MQLTDYIIDKNASVIDVMKKIDKNAKGVVYVCEKESLCGSITDGDLRRYILNNGSMSANATSIMNNSPAFCDINSRNNAKRMMSQLHIRSMPVINDDKKIIDIVFLDSNEEVVEKQQLNIPVVIMAGGKGTRLYPYTQILPKPLMPIGEKTITEHIMDRFKSYGCNSFTMIVNYKKHFIKSYFADNEGHNINFVEEDYFLGTGGGLKLLTGKYNSTFFMTNCDVLIEEDYSKILDFHKKQKNIVTMVCAKKQVTLPYGTVELLGTGNVIGLKEKPEFFINTNTGFYVLEPEFISEIPDNTFIHITDIIQKCIEKGERVGAYSISDDCWLDMGQMEEMEKMKKRLGIKDKY